MEKKERIKKLAKFAGFIEKGTGYVWPDGRFDKAPDFPNSLDACFKWLVPKLLKEYGLWRIIFGWTREGICDRCTMLFNSITGLEVSDKRIKTPALALCKAIEKLIAAESE